ncbi:MULTISPECIES: hypothetical protein [Cysteiniphilum]|uniref:Secretin/TonB short N-terminal domain-containing protein n=1 Tax=Cysteiniphilum litorale TaxID=2056700 RepID=A0A8J3E7R1_9GAMM|nr:MULTISPECIES: hypothetical protein [Cysteiniphilum]GGF92573.1 hypothetical protein GCM10010995_07150 [Cysteiniphilum litorale]
MNIKQLMAPLLLASAVSAYADMSILSSIPEVPTSNGSKIHAQLNNIPLKALLLSIYPGYTISLNQVDDIPISIPATKNDAVSILQEVSKIYHLSFDVNPDKQTVTVKPQQTITYQSYLNGWKDLQSKADLLSQTQAELAAQKKALEKAYADSPYPVPDIKAEHINTTTKTQALTLVVSPFISDELEIEIDNMYKKHLLSQQFKDYLKEKHLSFYQNDKTHKLSIASTESIAKTLAQEHVYYAIKGSQLKATIYQWAKKDKLSINADVLPDASLKTNVIYAGSLTTNNLADNPLYQLISDALGWEKNDA